MDTQSEAKRFRNLVWCHIVAAFAAMVAWMSEPAKLGGALAEHITGFQETDQFTAISLFSGVGAVAVILSMLGLFLRWRWAKLYTLVLTGLILVFDLLMKRAIVNTSAALTFLKLGTLVLGAILHALYFTEFGRAWKNQRTAPTA